MAEDRVSVAEPVEDGKEAPVAKNLSRKEKAILRKSVARVDYLHRYQPENTRAIVALERRIDRLFK